MTRRRSSPPWPRPRRLLLAVTLAALSMLLTGAPAAAHGQEVLISLEATAGDGGTAEITAVVTFRSDGHPVDGAVLETTAARGGEQVSVTLAPAGEPGTYAGTADLAPGTWEITTEATGDHAGTAVTELTVAEPTTTTAPTTTTPPATTAAPATTPAPETTDPAGAAPAEGEPAAAGTRSSPLLVLAPVALVALGAGVLTWRRIRSA